MEGGEGELVGRDEPLRALATAVNGDRPTVVLGEAGIGKTTLIRAAIAASGRRAFEGGGFATLAWVPYLAIRRAIRAPVAGDPAAVAALVERAVGPEALFIDDVQWVDEETLAALRLLVGRVTIVGAIRAGDPEADRTSDLLASWGFGRMALDPLTREAATALVGRLRPGLRPATADRIVTRSAGNPLVIEELAIRGAPSPVLARALSARVDRLSPRGKDAVRLLAVVDRPVPVDRLPRGVHEAVARGLVVVADGMAALRHDTVGDVIRERLADTERRRLHRLAARVVDEPAAVAQHLAAGGRTRAAEAVADAALRTTADLRDRAMLMEIRASAARGRVGFERRLLAARQFDELSDWPTVDRLLTQPPPRGAPELAVTRAVLRARSAHAQGRLEEARRLLADAETITIPPGSVADADRVFEACRFAVNVDGAVSASIARLDEAIGSMRGSAPSRGGTALGVLRDAIAILALGIGDVDELRSACDAALADDAPRWGSELARVVAYALLMHRGAADAVAWSANRREAFERASLAGVALLCQAETAQALVLAGRYGDAVAEADELLEQPAPIRARQAALIARVRALAILGRFDAASDLETARAGFTADWFGAGEASAVLAEVALWSGRADLAIRHADAALGIPSPVPGGDVGRTLVRDWACVDAGIGVAERLPVPPVPSLAGAGPEADGIRFLIAGDGEHGASAFGSAVLAWTGFNEPRALMCRWAEGEALRVAGSLDAAATVLRATLDLALEAGAEPIAARTRRSLRRAGVRIPGATGRPRGPELRLTGRERELVELVQAGLTNAEIARRLGLGRPTVARILASAMDKSGFDRRTQLAATVLEAG